MVPPGLSLGLVDMTSQPAGDMSFRRPGGRSHLSAAALSSGEHRVLAYLALKAQQGRTRVLGRARRGDEKTYPPLAFS